MFKALTLFILTLFGGLGAAWAGTPGGLSSPLVDHSIYQPGAIARMAGRYDDWLVACDEIAALKQRFCSMRSRSGRDAHGQVVRIDVSTGDDGKPAALLHLPLLISVAAGVEIRTGKGDGNSRRHVSIATCSAAECLAVWNLDTAALGALLSGHALELAYCSIRPGRLEFAPDLHRRSCETRLATALSGVGFRAAVAAATHP